MNNQKSVIFSIFSIASILGSLLPIATGAEQLISQKQPTVKYITVPNPVPSLIQPDPKADSTKKPPRKGIPLQLRPFTNTRGLTVKPDETVTNPDGLKIYPDGTNIYPNGTNVWFNLTTVYPDGTTVWADGTTIHPDGSATAPDGSPITINPQVIAPDEAKLKQL